MRKFKKRYSLSIVAFFLVLIGIVVFFSNRNFIQPTPALAVTPVFWFYGQNPGPDGLASGITNLGKNGPSTINLNDTAHPYTGTSSLAWTATTALDETYLTSATPIDMTQYVYLDFYGKATQANQLYDVTLLGAPSNGKPTLIGQVQPFGVGGGPLSATGWISYALSLSGFNAGTTPVYGIGFREVSGAAQPPVYLDEIMFSALRGVETTPPITVATPAAATVSPAGPVMPYYPDISPWVFIIPGIIILLVVIFE
jgi:hypothetical protein